MPISKSTYLVSVVVVTVMIASVTVFKGGKGSGQQNVRVTNPRGYIDHKDRYPVVESDEPEPDDPVKKAKLRKQKKRYDNDAPFTNPGPRDEELAFRPEAQFDFPALPVAKSDLIVVGLVLDAQAHRSENKMNIFSNLQVRVDEVLKGSNSTNGTITVERIGGFVKYPTGRKVLFRLSGNGMPAVGMRYVFFLNLVDDAYNILTAYELGAEGVIPLDNSPQFRAYQGESESNFLETLRHAISQSLPQD